MNAAKRVNNVWKFERSEFETCEIDLQLFIIS